MLIHEYGNRENPRIVLLHPMLTDGAMIAEYFRPLYGRYHVIAPDFSGQGADRGTFLSAKNEASDLMRFLHSGSGGTVRIRFLFGASLGTVVAAELLKRPDVRCDMVLLDGAVLSDRRHRTIAGIAAAAAFAAARAAGKVFPHVIERHIQKNFGPFGSSMMRSFMRTSGRSVKNMLISCMSSGFPPLTEEQQKSLCFVYGERDGLSRSARPVKKHYPAAHVRVLKGYGHCEYLAKHSDEYMGKIEKMLDGWEKREQKNAGAGSP